RVLEETCASGGPMKLVPADRLDVIERRDRQQGAGSVQEIKDEMIDAMPLKRRFARPSQMRRSIVRPPHLSNDSQLAARYGSQGSADRAFVSVAFRNIE